MKFNVVIAANMPMKDDLAAYLGENCHGRVRLGGFSAAARAVEFCWEGITLAFRGPGPAAGAPGFEKGETRVVFPPGVEPPADLPPWVEIMYIDIADIPGGERVLEGLDLSSTTFFASADLYLMNAIEIARFIRDSTAYTCQIMVPFVRRENFESAFGKMEKQFFKLAEGKFAFARVSMAETGVARRCAAKVARMFELAEEPLELAKTMGFRISMKYAIGRLSVADIEGFVDTHLEVNSKLVTSDVPALTLSINTVDRMRELKRRLKG